MPFVLRPLRLLLLLRLSESVPEGRNDLLSSVKKNGKKLTLEMSETQVTLSEREKKVEKVEEKVISTVALQQLKQQKLWLRIDADFRPQTGKGMMPGTDTAKFYYSLDGQEWHKIGSDYRLNFDWRRFFMGSKFGIFNYATKKVGGYVDIDEFAYNKIQ